MSIFSLLNSMLLHANGGTGDANDHDKDSIVKWPERKQSGDTIYGLHPNIYGEPTEGPEVGAVTNLGYAKTLVVDLQPCKAEFGVSGGNGKPTMGLQLFNVSKDKGQPIFEDILNQLSLFDKGLPKGPYRFAILNDVSIAESWSSDYGETTFEGLANVGSKGIRELKAIGVFENPEVAELQNAIKSAMTKIGGDSGAAATQLLEGSKVDFPTIWQGSSYSPQYQFTVRLYNPDPTDPKLYKENVKRRNY